MFNKITNDRCFNKNCILNILPHFRFALKRIIPRGLNYHLIFYRTIFKILFSLVVISAFSFNDDGGASLGRFFKVSLNDWSFALAICFFSFYGLYYFTNALKHGRYTVVAPLFLSGGYVLFCDKILYFLYDEVVNECGFYLLYFYLEHFHFSPIYLSKNISPFQGNIPLLIVLFILGVSFVLYPISIEAFGVYNFSLILEICSRYLVFTIPF